MTLFVYPDKKDVVFGLVLSLKDRFGRLKGYLVLAAFSAVDQADIDFLVHNDKSNCLNSSIVDTSTFWPFKTKVGVALSPIELASARSC